MSSGVLGRDGSGAEGEAIFDGEAVLGVAEESKVYSRTSTRRVSDSMRSRRGA
jgi:hypothetical protein